LDFHLLNLFESPEIINSVHVKIIN
jgi:hypothetical protein